MPSLHNVLKLKAGVRATTSQARVLPSGVKNQNQKACREKQPHRSSPSSSSPSASSRPSFVNSFVSSFSSSASSAPSAAPSTASFNVGVAGLDLRHGKDTGLTASEALYRAVSTPSVHRPLRQSSQPLIIHPNDPEWAKGFSVKVAFVNTPRGRTEDVLLGKASTKGGNAPRDRGSPKGHLKDSGNALSSLRPEVWQERRQTELGVEGREGASKRESLAELDKNSIDSRRERTEPSEDVAKSTSLCSERKPIEDGVARIMFQELTIEREVDTIGKVDGWNGGRTAGGLQPLGNRLRPFIICNESTIIPRSGGLFRRALHDVSLAGEGGTLDPPSDNARSAQSQQSASDGNSLKLVSGACNLPHPDKVKTGGEDAYFICPDRHVFGVADGVGGWSDLGIDAGEYARELMSQCNIDLCDGESALSDQVQRDLEAANLGDSGFVIVRNSRTIFKSPVQQHQFNIPFQLENGGSDPPSAAQVFSFPVLLGDIIVAGTDGLFDNLYDGELTAVVVQAVRGGLTPQVTARKIAALARCRAQDRNRQTPFSTAAQDAGFRFYGGKMDDITVIVSYITSAKPAACRL